MSTTIGAPLAVCLRSTANTKIRPIPRLPSDAGTQRHRPAGLACHRDDRRADHAAIAILGGAADHHRAIVGVAAPRARRDRDDGEHHPAPAPPAPPRRRRHQRLSTVAV
ncbi:MAG: hypothetical protein E6J91_23150 [Deltaproteobacteria bacterium]|nr:MAG: hypothetical protein E6J91_23150 [Deltaproteobacteria bacterium]